MKFLLSWRFAVNFDSFCLATIAAYPSHYLSVSFFSYLRPAIAAQYILPKHALTAFAGLVATREWGFATTRLIRWFIDKYQVNMSEAADSDPSVYPSFNAFFTRALAEGVRPLARAQLICPVDGAISQLGEIDKDQIFQAKGHRFSTSNLLGFVDASLAAHFNNGLFANIYLSPKDYHRIHMPCAGQLLSMTFIPGCLFSVNPVTAQGVPNLFARNERVVCWFESPDPLIGKFALVLVGATIVGSVATSWHGVVNSPRTKRMGQWHYEQQSIFLQQGQEMGRFLLGSTVIMLFSQTAAARLHFNTQWQAGRSVRMGEYMASA